MITLFLIIWLALSCYVGARRGFVLQLIYTIGYLISFVIAESSYLSLSRKLMLFIPYPAPTLETKLVLYNSSIVLSLDESFTAGISFLIVLLIGWLITHFIGIFFYNVTFFAVLKKGNKLGGALLSFCVVYVGVFLLLFVLSMIPLAGIQGYFESSGFARFIVERTPYFSKHIYDLWITSVIM